MNTSKILNWLLIISLIALVAVYVWEHYYLPGKMLTAPVTSGVPKTTVPIEERYTDKNGVEHSIITDGQNVISKAEFLNPNRQKTQLDTAAENLKIAKSEILRITQINSLTKDSLLKAKTVINKLTNKIDAYEYQDKYVKLRYTPPIDKADSTQTGTFDFQYNADLNIVQYQKRKWFLGAKKSYIDISSTDKRTTIRGVKQLTIEQKAPQFGLRAQGAVNWNPQTNSVGFGPAVRVDAGRFSFAGNYLFYPQSGRWRPGLTANFDLLRF